MTPSYARGARWNPERFAVAENLIALSAGFLDAPRPGGLPAQHGPFRWASSFSRHHSRPDARRRLGVPHARDPRAGSVSVRCLWSSRVALFLWLADTNATRPPSVALGHPVAYLNSGSILSPSLVPPGNRTFLSANFRVSYGTTTKRVPIPRKRCSIRPRATTIPTFSLTWKGVHRWEATLPLVSIHRKGLLPDAFQGLRAELSNQTNT